jgi:hypothetical protein
MSNRGSFGVTARNGNFSTLRPFVVDLTKRKAPGFDYGSLWPFTALNSWTASLSTAFNSWTELRLKS